MKESVFLEAVAETRPDKAEIDLSGCELVIDMGHMGLCGLFDKCKHLNAGNFVPDSRGDYWRTLGINKAKLDTSHLGCRCCLTTHMSKDTIGPFGPVTQNISSSSESHRLMAFTSSSLEVGLKRFESGSVSEHASLSPI